MVLPSLEAISKDWMMEGAKEEAEEAVVTGAVAGSAAGTVGMATEGRDGRGVKAPRPPSTLWFNKEMCVNVEHKLQALSLFA